MSVIARRSGVKIEVIAGNRRLEAMLQVHGYAEVLLDGDTVIVVKGENGELVESEPESGLANN
jgi:hypothetical protein